MKVNLSHIITSAAFCFVVIVFRSGYRLLSKCEIHSSCHRTWHNDDAIMALAILPLVGRAVCTAYVLELGVTGAPPRDLKLAAKLVIISRLSYALFLWCLKFCLLTFYSRMDNGSSYMRKGVRVMWCVLAVTLIGVLLVTLVECRALSHFWNIDSDSSCRKGLANLLTMAVCNVVTDIALIILPIPMLRHMTLNRSKKIQLSLIFGAGVFVIAVTIARLPLILDQSVSQSVKSLWASIEMAVACLVANVAFFYALIKDVSRGHKNSRASLSARGRQSVAVPRTSVTIYKEDSMRYSLRASLDKVHSRDTATTSRGSWDMVDFNGRDEGG